MLTIDIPGSAPVSLAHLVLDYNGTLARDGELIAGVAERLRKLGDSLKLHVITADTHGTVEQKLRDLPVKLKIIGADRQDRQKDEYVKTLGCKSVVAMGNGRNDIRMLSSADLGIGLLQAEGIAAGVIIAADVICSSIVDALDLLIYPDRLRATLRN